MNRSVMAIPIVLRVPLRSTLTALLMVVCTGAPACRMARVGIVAGQPHTRADRPPDRTLADDPAHLVAVRRMAASSIPR